MKKIGFGNQCMIALILGLVAGKFLPDQMVELIIPFGSAFLKLLKLVIVPLTFSTIVASFSQLEHISLVQKLGVSTLKWFMITAIIASTVGVVVGSLFHPGLGLSLTAAELNNYHPRQIPNFSQTILDMLPGNIIQQINQDKIIPLIIFALMFGVALTALHEKANELKIFFNQFAQVMFKITRFIIRLSPIGIFALIVDISSHYGFKTLMPVAKFIIAIYVACILMLFIYGILITIIAKRNPLVFFKQFWPAIITAFTTSSSLGTLAVTIETLVDNVKLQQRVVGFIAPLGATMKMDGCGAIYPAIVCVLTANIFGIDLSIQQYLMIIVTAAIATIGTAGVPGTASIMATVVLVAVGLPLDGLALVIGIDKIVDMIRTVTNVTGSAVVCSIIDRKYHEIT